MDDKPLTRDLTLDEAFRAAFYMALAYYERGHGAENDQELFVQYMWSDPARWGDWTEAVKRALADGGIADPDHSSQHQLRGDWPTRIED